MVDLWVTGVISPPPTLFPHEVGEKLAPPPRGGAEEAAMARGHCRRKGVAGAAVVAVAAHLKKQNELKKVVFVIYFN